MSRNTITITAPNGAKVRTVHSKRLFVVRWGTARKYLGARTDSFVSPVSEYAAEATPFATVDKRTDSHVTALSALRKSGQNSAVYATWHNAETGKTEGRFLTRVEVESRAQTEKNQKQWLDNLPTRGF